MGENGRGAGALANREVRRNPRQCILFSLCRDKGDASGGAGRSFSEKGHTEHG
jgi:hypothetical protein